MFKIYLIIYVHFKFYSYILRILFFRLKRKKMTLNSNRNIQKFPKCKVCGAGVFLTVEAFYDHISQNHSFPGDKNVEFIPEFQKSNKENKETEVEKTNEVFEKEPILNLSRFHNKKTKVECPAKCGKFLSSHGAIRKHLLSHRPKHEWPYQCEFCLKRFQARADLPKHYNTAQHKNDPNIPKQGTPEWNALIQRCKVIP